MPKRPPRAHHSAPCQHPTASGSPCPNRAVDHDHQHGPICALHAHHQEASEGRTATILVRLAPDERQAVQIAADTLGVSLSDLCRDMVLGLELPQPPTPKVDVQTYAQLGKVGGNLNQIAHALNALVLAGGTPDRTILEGLADEVLSLRAAIKEVRLGLVGGTT